MGKKTSQTSMKIPKHEKKQPLNSLMKILRPKVYITDSKNFMRLVQELTGNGKLQETPSPPPPPHATHDVSITPPIIPITRSETTHVVIDDHQDQNSPDLMSFDSSSCFSTPLDGSPDLSMNYVSDDSWDSCSQKMYRDLEALLMEMDSNPAFNTSSDFDSSCYGSLMQQEVCAYDHYDDFSEAFII